MLVFSRKRGESIMIGDNIKIHIVDIPQQNKVRVGIEAPPDIPVHRQEVYDVIIENNLRKDKNEISGE